jgi:hypothetical protein
LATESNGLRVAAGEKRSDATVVAKSLIHSLSVTPREIGHVEFKQAA